MNRSRSASSQYDPAPQRDSGRHLHVRPPDYGYWLHLPAASAGAARRLDRAPEADLRRGGEVLWLTREATKPPNASAPPGSTSTASIATSN